MQSKTFLMTVGLAVIASSALAQGDGVRAPSRCSMAGRQHGVGPYLGKAKARYHLAADAPLRSCYKAGLDCFWLHRCLSTHGI